MRVFNVALIYLNNQTCNFAKLGEKKDSLISCNQRNSFNFSRMKLTKFGQKITCGCSASGKSFHKIYGAQLECCGNTLLAYDSSRIIKRAVTGDTGTVQILIK